MNADWRTDLLSMIAISWGVMVCDSGYAIPHKREQGSARTLSEVESSERGKSRGVIKKRGRHHILFSLSILRGSTIPVGNIVDSTIFPLFSLKKLWQVNYKPCVTQSGLTLCHSKRVNFKHRKSLTRKEKYFHF